MPSIFSITNTNKLAEEKINFFIDWFHFVVEHIGSCKEFELENPLSLIDKALFQLDKGLPNKKHVYITNYLGHHYFHNDEYWGSFESFKELKPLIVNYQSLANDARSAFIKNSGVEFTEKLTKVQRQLQESMFKESLDTIISYFVCAHTLQSHKEDLKYHTQILVTEYLFCDRSKNELNQVFKNIVSKDVAKFPFPNVVKTEKQRKSHILNSTLKQQFEGLLNLLQKPAQIDNYIFKVYGADFNSKTCFKYNKVTFYGKDHKRFDFIKSDVTKNKGGIDFFNDSQSFIFALVAVLTFAPNNPEIAVAKGRKEVETELRYLCYKLGRDLSIDTTKNYLVTNKRNFNQYGFHFSTKNFHEQFDQRTIIGLNDTPFHHLKKVNSQAKAHLLEYEHQYINALKYKSIPDLWHYLETLLNASKGNVDYIKERVSSIILNNVSFMAHKRVFEKLYYSLNSFDADYEKLKLEPADFPIILNALQKGKISNLLSKIEYPFIQELITYARRLTKINYSEEKQYYASLLTEAYEQRNFYIHQATINNKATIKLDGSIFLVVKRFRWVLLSEIKKNPSRTFSEIIESVTTQGNSLISN